jgi:hypothetical protein
MDEPVRGRLRTTSPRSLTSPNRSPHPESHHGYPANPPPAIPGRQRPRTSRKTVSGRKTTAATALKIHTPGPAARKSSSKFMRWIEAKDLPPAIVRDPRQIETLMSSHNTRFRGRVGPDWLAWRWVLTGMVTSPVSFSPQLGHPPSRAEVLAERDAAAPEAISAETGEQIELARQILAWLVGDTEEPPS